MCRRTTEQCYRVWCEAVRWLRGRRRHYSHGSDSRQARTGSLDNTQGWHRVAQAWFLYAWWIPIHGGIQHSGYFIQNQRGWRQRCLGWCAVLNFGLWNRSISATSWHTCTNTFTIHLRKPSIFRRRVDELELQKSWRYNLHRLHWVRAVQEAQVHRLQEFLHKRSQRGPELKG